MTRDDFLTKLRADPEYYLAMYLARFGNILNADNAATLFDEYNADPAQYRVAVHAAASEIRDQLFAKLLAEPAPVGRDSVIFTAGGNASGKSTIVEISRARETAQVVFDSTFSNPEHAARLVEQALRARKPVLILHVTRPLAESLRGMLERAQSIGRLVSIRQMILSQSGSATAIRELQETYRDDERGQFRFFNNRGVAPGEVLAIAELKSYAESRVELDDILHSEYCSGRISDPTFHRVRGSGVD